MFYIILRQGYIIPSLTVGEEKKLGTH